MVKPADRREAVSYLEERYEVSERRSCSILKIYRSAYKRPPTREEQAYLRMRIKEIAASWVRYGYWRIHVLLKREGWEINHKRVYRIYKA
jgi:putative transposase